MNIIGLEETDLHLLPTSVQWLVKAIGLAAALKLIKKHGGGMPVYVPVKISADHYLLHLIGAQAFATLVAEYGGDVLEIARCEKAARVLIHRKIRQEYAEGATQNELALRYEYTVRHIREILDGGEMADDRQCGLF